MAIVKETKKVFFQGASFELIKGNEIQDGSSLVKAKPELFEVNTKVDAVKTPKARKAPAKKEIKEELLIEEPVAVLDVQETLEIEEVKETPKRRRKKSQ